MRRRSFLERLQAADHGVKVRWLIVLSLLAMVFVVLMWLIYFRFTVKIAAPEPAGVDTNDQSDALRDQMQSFPGLN